MEMKINFEQLFNSAQQLNSTFETPSSELEQSLHSSLNSSFEYKFSFNQNHFDQQTAESQHIKLIEDQQQQQEVRSVQTKKSNKTKQSVTSLRPSQPGQRLYYQSQDSEMRKNKERQRLQNEKIAELKSMPFAPTINKNSRKLAEKIKTQPKQQIKGRPQPKTTLQLLEQQTLKECTFQPKLIAKNTKMQPKSKQQLFYYLHNTSKIKDLKLSRKIQQQADISKMKKVSKQAFIEFLKRNEEYNNVIKRKHELMKQQAEHYDLKTGQKLFSPKIIDNKFEYCFQKNTSNNHILISPKNADYRGNKLPSQGHKKLNSGQLEKPKVKSNIFAKKHRNDNYQPRQTGQNKHEISDKPMIPPQKQEEYYSQEYRQYSEQFDRRSAAIREASLSRHEIIPQESQHSFIQDSHRRVPDLQKQQQGQNNDFIDDDAVELQAEIWNSRQIRPFELSNVNQYLNASEQDEPQPRNNYVMDILNNLMSSKTQQE